MKKICLYSAFTLSFLYSGISFSSTSFDNLSCLTKDRIASVRQTPSSAIAVVFDACHTEITSKLASLNLSEQERKIAFLSILAHSMAPYGSSHSITLKDLLSDKVMDCDNYAILTGLFSRIFLDENFAVNFVGFDGGAIGNHAQLFVGEKGEELLLDPTIGLVARIGLNELLMGKPVQKDQLRIFRQRSDEKLDFFAETVIDAITNGKYRPSDILYHFSSLDEYLIFTEGGRQALRKNLTEHR